MRYRLLLVVSVLCLVLGRATAEPPVHVVKVDTTDAPEMAEFGKKVEAVARKWYPMLVEKLPSEGYQAPREVSITFKKDYNGVAYASGNRIVASTKFFTDHPDDLGAFVHELVHVVQSYGRGKRPGWLVEGIADYIRFYHYEPEKARPRPDARKAKYSDSYRTTGHFLNWAQEKYDKNLVIKLNTACREGKYSDELWKQSTGKTMEELGEEWKAGLGARK